MSAKAEAQSYFNRISSGHKNAVARPVIIDSYTQSVDRCFREMVESANNSGDCIINAGFGYFRPIPSNVIDRTYYKAYKATEHSKIESMLHKEESMETAFRNWEKEAQCGNK